MLLLGLLRRNYEWPALWNIPEQRRAQGRLPHDLVMQLRCSSRTEGILRACLDPRARETILLKLFHPLDLFEKGDYKLDTDYDPPRIRSPRELVERIGAAQR
jgi:hypothetical protein